MEITCTRCHQAVLPENCYCPYCGLPQFVYEADATASKVAESLDGTTPDASSVAWKPALRAAILLAIPAGLLSSGISPLGPFGLLWTGIAAAWAVNIYVRSQHAPWITTGAGVRIGLVTGLLAAWLAFSISGGALFVQRFALHHAAQIDSDWKIRVQQSQQMAQQWTSSLTTPDTDQAKAARSQVENWMISPSGHASIELVGSATNAIMLLLFAIGGGALGARWLARAHRSQL
jgi:RNA polymerase subunit RPABC4/transcription elongation factor Spt4